MPDLSNAITLATPFFVLLVVLEAILTRYGRAKGSYETRDTATSLMMGFGSLVAEVLFAWIGLDTMLYAYRFHILEIGVTGWAFAAAFILDDLIYYWTHRIGHRSRWFWASHVIHHSSQHFNLSTALRQTWTDPLNGLFLVKVPLALLGFHPALLVLVPTFVLAYQFFVHTETIGRLPAWIETIFNTPSHHRVHHGCDAQYLDANYGGVFIIWDRLFGTFVPEDDALPPHYGLVNNLGTFNPLRVASHEFVGLVRDLMRPGLTLRQRFFYCFAPPGWRHDGSGITSDVLKREAAALARQAVAAE